MAGKTNHAENKTLDHALGTTDWTFVGQMYLGLHTADPTEAGSGTEVSGGSYVRKAIDFNAAVSGSASSSGNVTFDTATGVWGAISHFGIWDAASGGNMRYFGPFTVTKSIGIGDIYGALAGDITITED